jgi:hypothetical protein
MKSNLQAAIGHGTKTKSRSTGKLAASLGLSPAKLDRDGNFDVKVGFSEGRGDISNAMLANVLEYGKPLSAAEAFLKADEIIESKTLCRGDAARIEGGTGSPVGMLEELNTIVESAGFLWRPAFSLPQRRTRMS